MHFVHASGKSPKSGELFGGLGQRKQAKRPTIVKLQADPNNKPPQHNRYLTPTFGNDLESPEFNDIPSPLISPTQTHTKQLFQSQDGPEKIFLTEAGVEYDALLSTQRTQGNKQTIESHNNFASPLTEIGNILEDDEELTMEDGNKTKLEYQKLQIMDLATTLVAFIGGFLTVLTYDLDFDDKDNEENLATVLLWVIFASTWIAILLNFIRYLQKIKFFKARNDISQKDNIFTTGNIWYVLFETGLLLLQPYPFIRNIKVYDNSSFIGVPYFYYLNEILSALIVVRVYLVVRCFLNNMIYKSPRAYRVGDMYGSETNYMYTIRCLMKVSPFKVVPISLGISIVVFGYMLRICERPLNRDPDVEIEFNSYWNAMWCVILTMTTVGYGDVYARTMFGRVVSFIMCMWGISIVSVMVVTLTNVLTMDPVEEKSLLVLRKLEMKKKATREAGLIITNIAKLSLVKKRAKTESKQNSMRKEIIRDIKHHLNKFKSASRRVKALDGNVGALEEVNRQISNLREDVKTLIENQEEFQRSMMQLMGQKCASSKVGSFTGLDSRVQDFEENVTVAKTR